MVQAPQLPVVFIGPMCSGKSTIAQSLAGQLSLPRYELDEMRWSYYAEVGYDSAALAPIAQAEGFAGVARYWKPFEAHAVERVLADAPQAIVDFGAGHSVYEDAILFSRVQRAMAPYRNVVLLLPSPDLDESVALLNARLAALLEKEVGAVEPAVLAINEHFVKHPSNHQLAKHVVFTRIRRQKRRARKSFSYLFAELGTHLTLVRGTLAKEFAAALLEQPPCHGCSVVAASKAP